ncbi:SAM-dependent methyltransferase [Dethiobacter alkaliphilus]|uniref:Cyclopropane-fatty-acyl-phospholipid synthase n=1 Tax=Dethiobacter alkaliphilus AHT 1 TaxID=555088 RepID=C0GJU9_DETAL|nr:cyclopropane-fatty-acyl-phospholipid synthase family protein [Dethiobacter alkaliphilus]EEG76407.1 Cyclopropane-fatty-acyl-phospholipid synthase [Dethiobacter alkaliphilus AHT 1]
MSTGAIKEKIEQGQAQLQKSCYQMVFSRMKGIPFEVKYWDGSIEFYGDETSRTANPAFRLIFREELPLQEMLADPKVRFGEAYMQGKIDVEGDLRDVFRLAVDNEEAFSEDLHALLKGFLDRQKQTSKDAQVEGVRYHYDLGNDFFRLWLDDTMSYSCAYFRSPEDTLHQAQLQKIDHTLSKLNLKEGEKLLDIGSGWGWLIIRAAKQYGVKAMGVTLSEEQLKETQRRIDSEGLNDKVSVRLVDYRELAKEKQTFDKVVSVGMFEHVGKENIPEYFKAIKSMLKPGGLSLLHTITRPREGATNPWLEKYIFPWGYIPSFREVAWELPEHGFHLLDAESLRMHYAMTTDCWARNYERVTDSVKERYGEEFVRMWRLYLTGCSVSFERTGLDIHQLLFSNGLNNKMPLTREYLYGGQAG